MDKRRMNIMTSCDDRIARYILPQLASIHENLCTYDVRFYLAESRVSDKNIKLLADFAEACKNITFADIKITDNTLYQTIADICKGRWPREAYYTLRPQDCLPADVDRILYIDADDVVIDGDISPYYFDGCVSSYEPSFTPVVYHFISPTKPRDARFSQDDMI